MAALLNSQDVKNYAIYNQLRDLLQKQRDSLRRLRGRNTAEYVVDLYHNARRRIAQENFPDALWRFVTIYEIILEQEAVKKIKERFKIEADPENFANSIALHRDVLKRLLQDVFDVRDPKDNSEFYKKVHRSLGREEAEGILTFLGGPLALQIASLPLKAMIDRRNALLHRMEFPREDDVRKDLDTICQFIQMVLTRDPEKDYPFSIENIGEVVKTIQEIYH